jgi:hypothetical protein
MLGSSNFWMGVAIGVVGVYAWRYMAAKKAAS